MLPSSGDLDVASTSSLLSQMDTFWQTCPYTAAALVCGVKASAADLIAQHQAHDIDIDIDIDIVPIEGQEQGEALQPLLPTLLPRMDDFWSWMDTKRNLAFVLYGSLYQGMVHEYVFNHLYPAWFGTGSELPIVLTKVAFNIFIQAPLVTLPVAYILKALVMQSDTATDTADTSTPIHTHVALTAVLQPLQSALHKYWQDIQYQNLLGKCIGIWGPVNCVTFSIIPEHYRVTFIAIVSFFWLILLSQISNNNNNPNTVAVADIDITNNNDTKYQ